jgi:hypothetical protein
MAILSPGLFPAEQSTNYFPPAPQTNQLRLNPNILQPLSGFASGNNVGEQFGNVNALLAGQQQKEAQQDTVNKTVQMLQAKSPELANAVAAGTMTPGDAYTAYVKQQQDAAKASRPEYGFLNINGRLVRTDKNSGDFSELGNYEQPEKPTDDQREYEMAKKQGFEGTFFDYMVKMKEAGRTKVDIDTGEKLPAGFRWKDTNKKELGVEPIPGGPGEQVPGELAARVGLAENFQRQLPNIQEKVKQGAVTGMFDRAWAGWVGTGEGAETYRQIQSGVDSLQRLLTGAGMNITEAQNYSQRYLPSYTDDAQTVISKLNQLSQELESAKSMAMRGRGGDQSQQNNATSVDDLVKKYGKP